MKTAFLLFFFILVSFSVKSFGALPPTTLSGMDDTTKTTTFNFKVPNKQATKVGGGTLIETGNGNVLPDPGFEGVVLGWVSYKDAAAATPENGIGGTAVSAINFTASSPLRGAKSGLFVKPTTVNSLGEGFSKDFTIDGADKTKILDISFDYSTSANYADGDMRIYIFDVSNARMIELVNRDLMANANGTYRGFFQASPDSVNYRLIGHVATTKTSDYTVKLDNVKVAPQAPKVTGAVETDPAPYTPIISGLGAGSVINLYGSWKRRGSNIEIIVRFRKDATPGTGTGTVTVSLPLGLSIDTSVSSNGGFLLGNSGKGLGSDSIFIPYQVSATAVGLMQNDSTVLQGSEVGANLFVETRFIAPILGWSSNMVLSEDAGNREIVYRGINTRSTALPATTYTTLTLSAQEDTTASGVSDGWICPETAYYDIAAAVTKSAGVQADEDFFGAIHVGGLESFLLSRRALFGTSALGASTGSMVGVKILKGQKVELKAWSSSSDTVVAQNYRSFLSIAKRSSPQTIAASETVAVHAVHSSGQSIPASTLTTLIWNTKLLDTHNALDISTGIFTAPMSGLYEVEAKATFSLVTWANGNLIDFYITHTQGTVQHSVARVITGSYGNEVGALNTSKVYLKKGDTIKVSIWHNRAATTSIFNNSAYNTLTITRVGN